MGKKKVSAPEQDVKDMMNMGLVGNTEPEPPAITQVYENAKQGKLTATPVESKVDELNKNKRLHKQEVDKTTIPDWVKSRPDPQIAEQTRQAYENIALEKSGFDKFNDKIAFGELLDYDDNTKSVKIKKDPELIRQDLKGKMLEYLDKNPDYKKFLEKNPVGGTFMQGQVYGDTDTKWLKESFEYLNSAIFGSDHNMQGDLSRVVNWYLKTNSTLDKLSKAYRAGHTDIKREDQSPSTIARNIGTGFFKNYAKTAIADFASSIMGQSPDYAEKFGNVVGGFLDPVAYGNKLINQYETDKARRERGVFKLFTNPAEAFFSDDPTDRELIEKINPILQQGGKKGYDAFVEMNNPSTSQFWLNFLYGATDLATSMYAPKGNFSIAMQGMNNIQNKARLLRDAGGDLAKYSQLKKGQALNNFSRQVDDITEEILTSGKYLKDGEVVKKLEDRGQVINKLWDMTFQGKSFKLDGIDIESAKDLYGSFGQSALKAGIASGVSALLTNPEMSIEEIKESAVNMMGIDFANNIAFRPLAMIGKGLTFAKYLTKPDPAVAQKIKGMYELAMGLGSFPSQAAYTALNRTLAGQPMEWDREFASEMLFNLFFGFKNVHDTRQYRKAALETRQYAEETAKGDAFLADNPNFIKIEKQPIKVEKPTIPQEIVQSKKGLRRDADGRWQVNTEEYEFAPKTAADGIFAMMESKVGAKEEYTLGDLLKTVPEYLDMTPEEQRVISLLGDNLADKKVKRGQLESEHTLWEQDGTIYVNGSEKSNMADPVTVFRSALHEGLHVAFAPKLDPKSKQYDPELYKTIDGIREETVGMVNKYLSKSDAELRRLGITPLSDHEYEMASYALFGGSWADMDLEGLPAEKMLGRPVDEFLSMMYDTEGKGLRRFIQEVSLAENGKKSFLQGWAEKIGPKLWGKAEGTNIQKRLEKIIEDNIGQVEDVAGGDINFMPEKVLRSDNFKRFFGNWEFNPKEASYLTEDMPAKIRRLEAKIFADDPESGYYRYLDDQDDASARIYQYEQQMKQLDGEIIQANDDAAYNIYLIDHPEKRKLVNEGILSKDDILRMYNEEQQNLDYIADDNEVTVGEESSLLPLYKPSDKRRPSHPMMIFHGSQSDFGTLDRPLRVLRGDRAAGKDLAGFYATVNASDASKYAENDNRSLNKEDVATGPNVMPFYGNMRNPIIVSLSLKSDDMSPLSYQYDKNGNEVPLPHSIYDEDGSIVRADNPLYPSYFTREHLKFYQDMGYDGVIFEKGAELIFFDPQKQLKSAYGNNGNFDINYADINFMPEAISNLDKLKEEEIYSKSVSFVNDAEANTPELPSKVNEFVKDYKPESVASFFGFESAKLFWKAFSANPERFYNEVEKKVEADETIPKDRKRKISLKYRQQMENMEEHATVFYNKPKKDKDGKVTYQPHKVQIGGKINDKNVPGIGIKMPYISTGIASVKTFAENSIFASPRVKKLLNRISEGKFVALNRDVNGEKLFDDTWSDPDFRKSLAEQGFFYIPFGNSGRTILHIEALANKKTKGLKEGVLAGAREMAKFQFLKWLNSEANGRLVDKMPVLKDIDMTKLAKHKLGIEPVGYAELFSDRVEPLQGQATFDGIFKTIEPLWTKYYTSIDGKLRENAIKNTWINDLSEPNTWELLRQQVSNVFHDMINGSMSAYTIKRSGNQVKQQKGVWKYGNSAKTTEPLFFTSGSRFLDYIGLRNEDGTVNEQAVKDKLLRYDKETDILYNRIVHLDPLTTKLLGEALNQPTLFDKARTDAAVIYTNDNLYKDMDDIFGNKEATLHKFKYAETSPNGNSYILKSGAYKFPQGELAPKLQALIDGWGRSVNMVTFDTSSKGNGTYRYEYRPVGDDMYLAVGSDGMPIVQDIETAEGVKGQYLAGTYVGGEFKADPAISEMVTMMTVERLAKGEMPEYLGKDMQVAGGNPMIFHSTSKAPKRMEHNAIGIPSILKSHPNDPIWTEGNGPQAFAAYQEYFKNIALKSARGIDAVTSVRGMLEDMFDPNSLDYISDTLPVNTSKIAEGIEIMAKKIATLDEEGYDTPDWQTIYGNKGISDILQDMIITQEDESGTFKSVRKEALPFLYMLKEVFVGGTNYAAENAMIHNTIKSLVNNAINVRGRGAYLTIVPDLGRDVEAFIDKNIRADKEFKAQRRESLENVDMLNKALESGAITLSEYNKGMEELKADLDSIIDGQQIREFFDPETGMLKDFSQGAIIGTDIARRLGLKLGEKIFGLITPFDDIHCIVPLTIAGFSDTKATFTMNAKYLSEVLGRDYDKDAISIMTSSKEFPQFETFWEHMTQVGIPKGIFKKDLGEFLKLAEIQENGKSAMFNKLGLPPSAHLDKTRGVHLSDDTAQSNAIKMHSGQNDIAIRNNLASIFGSKHGWNDGKITIDYIDSDKKVFSFFTLSYPVDKDLELSALIQYMVDTYDTFDFDPAKALVWMAMATDPNRNKIFTDDKYWTQLKQALAQYGWADANKAKKTDGFEDFAGAIDTRPLPPPEQADIPRTFAIHAIAGTEYFSKSVSSKVPAYKKTADTKIDLGVSEKIITKDNEVKYFDPLSKGPTALANHIVDKIKQGVKAKARPTIDRAALMAKIKAEQEAEKSGTPITAQPSNQVSEIITRDYVKSNPDKVFLFGDNLVKRGLGGQAKEMRGEPNAYGIPTKKSPSMDESAFFNDNEYEANVKAIDDAIALIPRDKPIVIPDIGTGLSRLSEKAPRTFKYLQERLQELAQPASVEQTTPVSKGLSKEQEKAFLQDGDFNETAEGIADEAFDNIVDAIKEKRPPLKELQTLLDDRNAAIDIISFSNAVHSNIIEGQDEWLNSKEGRREFVKKYLPELLSTVEASYDQTIDVFSGTTKAEQENASKLASAEKWDDFVLRELDTYFDEMVKQKEMAIKKFPSQTTTVSGLDRFVDHSGGADGSDSEWDKAGREKGFDNHNHYYHGSKTPKGNKQISTQDFEEGRVESARAAARNWGYTYKTMKDERLIRNWAQVKYADNIYAVGHIVEAGEKVFPDQKSDTRTAIAPSVTGGTGYAVGMAILHDKPVYVFNQSKRNKYDIGWHKWDGTDFVPTDTPVLSENYAGIGTRNINESGKQAIRDVFAKTLEQQQTTPDVAGMDRQQKEQFVMDNARQASNLSRMPDIALKGRAEGIAKRLQNEATPTTEPVQGDGKTRVHLTVPIDKVKGTFRKNKEEFLFKTAKALKVMMDENPELKDVILQSDDNSLISALANAGLNVESLVSGDYTLAKMPQATAEIARKTIFKYATTKLSDSIGNTLKNDLQQKLGEKNMANFENRIASLKKTFAYYQLKSAMRPKVYTRDEQIVKGNETVDDIVFGTYFNYITNSRTFKGGFKYESNTKNIAEVVKGEQDVILKGVWNNHAEGRRTPEISVKGLFNEDGTISTSFSEAKLLTNSEESGIIKVDDKPAGILELYNTQLGQAEQQDLIAKTLINVAKFMAKTANSKGKAVTPDELLLGLLTIPHNGENILSTDGRAGAVKDDKGLTTYDKTILAAIPDFKGKDNLNKLHFGDPVALIARLKDAGYNLTYEGQTLGEHFKDAVMEIGEKYDTPIVVPPSYENANFMPERKPSKRFGSINANIKELGITKGQIDQMNETEFNAFVEDRLRKKATDILRLHEEINQDRIDPGQADAYSQYLTETFNNFFNKFTAGNIESIKNKIVNDRQGRKSKHVEASMKTLKSQMLISYFNAMKEFYRERKVSPFQYIKSIVTGVAKSEGDHKLFESWYREDIITNNTLYKDLYMADEELYSLPRIANGKAEYSDMHRVLVMDQINSLTQAQQGVFTMAKAVAKFVIPAKQHNIIREGMELSLDKWAGRTVATTNFGITLGKLSNVEFYTDMLQLPTPTTPEEQLQQSVLTEGLKGEINNILKTIAVNSTYTPTRDIESTVQFGKVLLAHGNDDYNAIAAEVSNAIMTKIMELGIKPSNFNELNNQLKDIATPVVQGIRFASEQATRLVALAESMKGISQNLTGDVQAMVINKAKELQEMADELNTVGQAFDIDNFAKTFRRLSLSTADKYRLLNSAADKRDMLKFRVDNNRDARLKVFNEILIGSKLFTADEVKDRYSPLRDTYGGMASYYKDIAKQQNALPSVDSPEQMAYFAEQLFKYANTKAMFKKVNKEGKPYFTEEQARKIAEFAAIDFTEYYQKLYRNYEWGYDLLHKSGHKEFELPIEQLIAEQNLGKYLDLMELASQKITYITDVVKDRLFQDANVSFLFGQDPQVYKNAQERKQLLEGINVEAFLEALILNDKETTEAAGLQDLVYDRDANGNYNIADKAYKRGIEGLKDRIDSAMKESSYTLDGAMQMEYLKTPDDATATQATLSALSETTGFDTIYNHILTEQDFSKSNIHAGTPVKFFAKGASGDYETFVGLYVGRVALDDSPLEQPYIVVDRNSGRLYVFDPSAVSRISIGKGTYGNKKSIEVMGRHSNRILEIVKKSSFNNIAIKGKNEGDPDYAVKSSKLPVQEKHALTVSIQDLQNDLGKNATSFAVRQIDRLYKTFIFSTYTGAGELMAMMGTSAALLSGMDIPGAGVAIGVAGLNFMRKMIRFWTQNKVGGRYHTATTHPFVHPEMQNVIKRLWNTYVQHPFFGVPGTQFGGIFSDASSKQNNTGAIRGLAAVQRANKVRAEGQDLIATVYNNQLIDDYFAEMDKSVFSIASRNMLKAKYINSGLQHKEIQQLLAEYDANREKILNNKSTEAERKSELRKAGRGAEINAIEKEIHQQNLEIAANNKAISEKMKGILDGLNQDRVKLNTERASKGLEPLPMLGVTVDMNPNNPRLTITLGGEPVSAKELISVSWLDAAINLMTFNGGMMLVEAQATKEAFDMFNGFVDAQYQVLAGDPTYSLPPQLQHNLADMKTTNAVGDYGRVWGQLPVTAKFRDVYSRFSHPKIVDTTTGAHRRWQMMKAFKALADTPEAKAMIKAGYMPMLETIINSPKMDFWTQIGNATMKSALAKAIVYQMSGSLIAGVYQAVSDEIDNQLGVNRVVEVVTRLILDWTINLATELFQDDRQQAKAAAFTPYKANNRLARPTGFGNAMAYEALMATAYFTLQNATEDFKYNILDTPQRLIDLRGSKTGGNRYNVDQIAIDRWVTEYLERVSTPIGGRIIVPFTEQYQKTMKKLND